MAGKKALTLIRSMKPDEIERFRAYLGGKRDGKLKRLLDFLSGWEAATQPAPELLYEAVFLVAYEKDKDYLLRNELRHLSQQAKAFVAGPPPGETSTGSHPVALLEVLAERREWELFDKEFALLERQCEATEDVETMARAWELRSRQARMRYPLTEKGCLMAIQEAESCLLAQRKASLRQQLETWQLHQYYRRIASDLRIGHPPAIDPPLDGFGRDELTKSDQYTLEKGLYYSQQAEDRLLRLARLRKLVEEVRHPQFDRPREVQWVYACTGLEHFWAEEYELACEAFATGLDVEGPVDMALRMGLTFNYVSALLKTKQFGVAYDLMESWEPSFDSSTIQDKLICQRAMILLLNDDIAGAKRALKDYISYTSSDAYLYYRLILIVELYLRGDLLAAQAEVHNFRQGSIVRQPAYKNYSLGGKVFEQFLAIMVDRPVLSAQDFRTRLGELKASLKGHMKASNMLLHLYWIEKEVDRILSEA